MKIAIVADSHFDERANGRLKECIAIHDWMAYDMAARGVNLCLHSGDIFERSSTAVERNAVRAWVQKVANVCPFLIVRGNHTPLGQLDIFSHLQARYEIIVEEGAGVHVIGGAVIGCLAWPSKALVLAAAGPVSMEQSEQTAADAIRNVLRGLDGEMTREAELHGAEGAPRILLAHAMVRGARVSTGQPVIGASLEIGEGDLRLANADFYALGHVHCHGAFTDGPGDVVYPGSPRRTSYGEIEDKGYLIIECNGHDVSWEFVKTPCCPMLLMEAHWRVDTGGSGFLDFGSTACDPSGGAEIRLRYSVEASQRVAAAHAAETLKREWLEAGAAAVLLDPKTLTVSTAKAPAIAEAATTADKLRALWEHRAEDVDPSREARLMDKLEQIESAAD